METVREPYGLRLTRATDKYGPVCVGIDPHPALLERWGLGNDARGVEEFALRVIEAVSGVVAVVKPQSALFEAHGSAGVAALERTLAAARQAGLLSIADVKRGDIGSTMAGYAHAYLGEGSPLAADAMTVSPYLGFGSLAPCMQLAKQTGRGVYVLALTSNPEGAEVQHAKDDEGVAVARTVVQHAAAQNHSDCENGHIGSCGLVIGATTGNAAAALGIALNDANASILAPGFGAQGAKIDQVAGVFGNAARHVLVSVSRSILGVGPDVAALRAAARALNDQAMEAI